MKNSFSQSAGYKIHDVVNGQYDIEYETEAGQVAAVRIFGGLMLCLTIIGIFHGIASILSGVIGLSTPKTGKLTIVKQQGVICSNGSSIPFSNISRSFLESLSDAASSLRMITVDTLGTTVRIAGPMSEAAARDIQTILHQEMAAA